MRARAYTIQVAAREAAKRWNGQLRDGQLTVINGGVLYASRDGTHIVGFKWTALEKAIEAALTT